MRVCWPSAANRTRSRRSAAKCRCARERATRAQIMPGSLGAAPRRAYGTGPTWRFKYSVGVSFKLAHRDDCETAGNWQLVRRTLELRAFGINVVEIPAG